MKNYKENKTEKFLSKYSQQNPAQFNMGETVCNNRQERLMYLGPSSFTNNCMIF